MLKPPIPAHEARRLETLRSLNVLDTPAEERFDRVTRLAKQVFGVKIALVSLVDADRQWFKSRQGLDATETPRDISFCGHAILDDKIMLVNDATADERFCDNPLVCGDPNIRFYAGYPLSAPDGNRVGTLCVIDDQPRDVSREQLNLLRELGRMIEEELIAAATATIDPITGLSNRTGFAVIADHILPMCARVDSPASLLIMHFANLHEIDAALGHDESDACVVELAHLLMATFRDSDIIARVAADLFVVLLGNTDFDSVAVAKARFDERLSERNRGSKQDRQIELDIHAVVYRIARHPDANALLAEAERRVVDASNDDNYDQSATRP